MKPDVEWSIKDWTSKPLQRLRSKAIAWFNTHGRVLPWRQTSDPYAIWVSEIMLQQTQVATVIPYYSRFLKSFPDVRRLANASLDDVYQHWAGLGYYRRAKQMHAAAQQIELEYHGVFPTNYADVLALPGIGRYTAGAILSFAFDQRLPIVEANTLRLYARLLHLHSDTTTQASVTALWGFAEQVLPKGTGSGHLNQALMEIGSQVCLPKNPTCGICPLQRLCPTFEQNSQALVPAPKKPKVYTDLEEAALLIRDHQGRYLMRRCSSDERWAGLWDFPRFDVTGWSSTTTRTRRIATLFEERFHRSIAIGKVVHQLKHAVTRYRITLKSYEAEIEGLASNEKWPNNLDALWADQNRMETLALSSSGKRIWKWIESQSAI